MSKKYVSIRHKSGGTATSDLPDETLIVRFEQTGTALLEYADQEPDGLWKTKQWVKRDGAGQIVYRDRGSKCNYYVADPAGNKMLWWLDARGRHYVRHQSQTEVKPAGKAPSKQLPDYLRDARPTLHNFMFITPGGLVVKKWLAGSGGYADCGEFYNAQICAADLSITMQWLNPDGTYADRAPYNKLVLSPPKIDKERATQVCRVPPGSRE